MKGNALLVLTLVAAVSGPAWCQDYSQNPESNPYRRLESLFPSWRGPDIGGSANERSDADPDPNDATSPDVPDGGSSFGTKGSPADAMDPYRQPPAVPGALPYPEPPGTNPYGDDQARGFRGNGDPGGGASFGTDKTTKPSDDLSAPSYGASGADPYGASPLPAGPSAATRPKTKELNGDPSGLLGFNPYDASSILAPSVRSAKPGGSAGGNEALAPSLDSGLGTTMPGGLLK